MTGIAAHTWIGKHWARWGDALVDAGFSANQWNQKLDSTTILLGIIKACRHFGRFPTKRELELFSRNEPTIPSANAISRHFGSKDGLITAISEYISEDIDYVDIAEILPKLAIAKIESPAPSAKPRDGYVYLIKSGANYKVGRSDDAERRFKQISVALPDKAELFHTIRTDDPAGIESYWHRRFADKRANGEWFKLTNQDIAAFRKRKTM